MTKFNLMLAPSQLDWLRLRADAPEGGRRPAVGGRCLAWAGPASGMRAGAIRKGHGSDARRLRAAEGSGGVDAEDLEFGGEIAELV